jgi:hypothetical protein
MSESNTPTQDMAAEIKGREWTQDPERLRDFFAAAALQGLLAHEGAPHLYADAGRMAYEMADAMLVAREAA